MRRNQSDQDDFDTYIRCSSWSGSSSGRLDHTAASDSRPGQAKAKTPWLPVAVWSRAAQSLTKTVACSGCSPPPPLEKRFLSLVNLGPQDYVSSSFVIVWSGVHRESMSIRVGGLRKPNRACGRPTVQLETCTTVPRAV